MIKDAVALSRRNPIVLLLFGAAFAAGLALAGIENFWQPFFAQLRSSGVEDSPFFGALMAGNFLIGVAGNMLSIPLGRLLGGRHALAAAAFQGLQGLALVLLAVQTSTIPALAMFLMVYLNLNLLQSPQSALMNAEIPANRRSSMLSIFSLVGYAGSFLGSSGLGYLAEQVSIPAAWSLAGTVLMVSLLLYLRVAALQTRSSAHDPHPETVCETA